MAPRASPLTARTKARLAAAVFRLRQEFKTVSSQKGREDMQNEKRGIFDWLIFLLIHIVLIGGIGVAGFYVYGTRLGIWVAASATVAGFASAYLFAKEIPGETFMKVVLGLLVAANAAYLVHNGAKGMGVELYNREQSDRYVKGLAEQAKSKSVRIAREVGLSNKQATELARVFDDSVSLSAALLAFLELACALIIFAISSRRGTGTPQKAPRELPERADEFDEITALDIRPTGQLKAEPGKGYRR